MKKEILIGITVVSIVIIVAAGTFLFQALNSSESQEKSQEERMKKIAGFYIKEFTTDVEYQLILRENGTFELLAGIGSGSFEGSYRLEDDKIIFYDPLIKNYNATATFRVTEEGVEIISFEECHWLHHTLTLSGDYYKSKK